MVKTISPLCSGFIYFMEQEIWKDVIGWEGLYQVSNLGNIKSLARMTKSRGELIFDLYNKFKTKIK